MVWIFPKIGLSASFLNQQTLKGSTLRAVSHFCNISEYFSCPTLWKGSSAAKYHRKQTSKLLFVNKDLKEKGRLSWAREPFDHNHYDKQVKGFWPANDLQSLLLVVVALGYFLLIYVWIYIQEKDWERESWREASLFVSRTGTDSRLNSLSMSLKHLQIQPLRTMAQHASSAKPDEPTVFCVCLYIATVKTFFWQWVPNEHLFSQDLQKACSAMYAGHQADTKLEQDLVT